MAGIGPIFTDRRNLLKQAHYASAQPLPKNELYRHFTWMVFDE